MSSYLQKINHTYGKYWLLGIDFVLALASLMRYRYTFGLDEELLSISRDNGYAESFQYLKLAAIIGLLCFCAIIKKSAAIGGWAVVFGILLFDDKVSIHERGGAKLAEWLSFEPMFNLRANDFGELMIFATWGIIAIAVLGITYRTNRSELAKQIFRGLALSLLGLVIFGGFFDMLHIVLRNLVSETLIEDELFDVLEDGGEMVVISLALYFVYQKAQQVLVKHQMDKY